MPSKIFNFLSPIYDFLIKGAPPPELISLLELEGTETVLEIGAGTGRTVTEVSKFAGSLWLLDPSLAMLRISKKKIPNAKHIHGYAESLPFSDSFFDRIFAVDSLHHWDDQRAGIREVFRVLKPTGIFILVEFDPNTSKGHYIQSMERFLQMGSTFFSPQQLRRMIRNQTEMKITSQFYLDSGTYITVARKPAN